MTVNPDFRPAIARRITELSGDADVIGWQLLGKGTGGTRWRVQTRQRSWFLKSAAGSDELFVAEADGLNALAACAAARVPQVLDAGQQSGTGYIVTEWLELEHGRAAPHAAAKLGKALAQQHRMPASRFGWARHNFIGATPQFNSVSGNWLDFFRTHRLGFQLRLAAENGYRGELQTQAAQLLEKLPEFFAGYEPKPSLLHGDLWGGNWGVLESGEPVIFDPAVYYGDREADIAMTELFGGFPPEFYSAYNDEWPLDPGYAARRDLYNLYHILNHLNLFGDGYLAQVEQMLGSLLARSG